MNLHQIITGACNAGDKCFAIGSVEGVPFTAYASGCNVVILALHFERVQIIPGAIHDYVPVNAVDCSDDTGKIAAAYNNLIFIYEPTPLVNVPPSRHNLDYRWIKTARIECEDTIVALSWNLEGTRLLSASNVIELWHHVRKVDSKVKFTVGDTEINEINDMKLNEEKSCEKDEKEKDEDTNRIDILMDEWQLVWRTTIPIPILHIAFSCDGTLFATCGQNDRFVKIWYENKNVVILKKRAAERKRIKEEEERKKQELKMKMTIDNSDNDNKVQEIEEVKGNVHIETEIIGSKSETIQSARNEDTSVTTAIDALATLLDSHVYMDKFHQLSYRDDIENRSDKSTNSSENNDKSKKKKKLRP